MIQKKFIFYADLALLAICLTGVYQLWIKADLPFHLNDYNSRLLVDDPGNLTEIKKGDLILKVHGIKISSRDDIETITDGFSAGDTIQLTIRRNEETTATRCTLIRFYSLLYILTVMSAGIIFFAVAVIVLRKSPERKPAAVFHWVVTGTAAIMMTSWGSYAQFTFTALWLVRSVFHLAYLMVPVNFIHFTLVFPKVNFPWINKRIKYLYLISALAAVVTQTAFISFVNSRSPDALSFYTGIFTAGRVLMILCVTAGITLFILLYRRAQSASEKKKIKWILFSLITGPGSFILLWVIPQAFINYGLIPEEAVILLMTLVPVGFAFAIIRHHIFNIDHIINRSLVYSILLGVIAAVYFISVYILYSLVKKPDSPGIYLVTTAFVAFLILPLKVRIQGFVDRKFFRINYNFRKASRRLLEEIRNSGNPATLASKIEAELNNIIPSEQMGIYLSGETGFIYTAG
ncbi:MAG: PDZ domain-containing protein, partial [Syntrophothermus sp.]